MSYIIESIIESEYKEVVEVWENSVRATHYFLKEADIQYFKPRILNTYLDAVELRCIRNNTNQIVGFLGVAMNKLEMLFVHPEYIGKGIGKALLEYSIYELRVKEVDVNEQNEQAVEFYKHFGFIVEGRSESDSTGKPYPIVHMKLKK